MASPGTINVNGYAYTRAGEPDLVAADIPDGPDDLAGWRDVWLPRIEAASRTLETFDAASVGRGGWRETLEEQQRDFWRTFFGLHRHAVGPANAASAAFVERYTAVFGDGRRHDATALLQGFPNSSTDRSAALWGLSRVVREDADLRQAIERSRVPQGGSAAAERFRRGLDDLLDRFGDTSQMRLEDTPVWREDPSLAFSLVLRYAEQDGDGDPRHAQARQAERREALERELRERTATDDVDELLSLLPIAQLHLSTIEDHNSLGDQRMFAASRVRWLRIGRHLGGRGLVAEPDDVFYHHLDELIDSLDGGEAIDTAVIAERRAQQATWRAVTPPAFLGKPPGDEGAPGRPERTRHRRFARRPPRARTRRGHASSGARAGPGRRARRSGHRPGMDAVLRRDRRRRHRLGWAADARRHRRARVRHPGRRWHRRRD